jgi:hypothetical protein
MPDLSTQIGTLYRVIGVIGDAQSAGRGPQIQCPEPPLTGGPLRFRRGAPLRWICSFYCLWFSLPLSIWLSSGWIGLLLYWQVLSGAACLVEKIGRIAALGFPRAARSGLRCIQ